MIKDVLSQVSLKNFQSLQNLFRFHYFPLVQAYLSTNVGLIQAKLTRNGHLFHSVLLWLSNQLMIQQNAEMLIVVLIDNLA